MIRNSIRAAAGTVAAVALLASSSMVAAQPAASKLSLSNSKAVRAATPTAKSSRISGSAPWVALATFAAIGLTLALTLGNDSDSK